MNNILNKFKNLISKSGFLLFLIRFPRRSLKAILIKLNSKFWKFFLKECGSNVIIELGVNFENPKNIIIKDNVYIGAKSSFGTELAEGYLVLENNVHIGRNCKIDHTGDITIKEKTLFSENVKILSHSHGYNPRNKAIPMPLIIDENCWLGLNTIITENCSFISKNTITATGTIITKNVKEPNCIIAGVPAKKLKEYNFEQ
jgi:acetyltransferase-like isoleucine patch superfamily enzyme